MRVFFFRLAGKAISVAARTRSLPHPPAISIPIPLSLSLTVLSLSLSLFLARNFSLKHFCHVCHLFIFFFCRCSWLCMCVCESVCTIECVWKYIFVIFTQRFVGFLCRCLFLPLGFRFGFVFGVSSLGFWSGYFKEVGEGAAKGGTAWSLQQFLNFFL